MPILGPAAGPVLQRPEVPAGVFRMREGLGHGGGKGSTGDIQYHKNYRYFSLSLFYIYIYILYITAQPTRILKPLLRGRSQSCQGFLQTSGPQLAVGHAALSPGDGSQGASSMRSANGHVHIELFISWVITHALVGPNYTSSIS